MVRSFRPLLTLLGVLLLTLQGASAFARVATQNPASGFLTVTEQRVGETSLASAERIEQKSAFSYETVSGFSVAAKGTGKFHDHHSDPKFLGGDPKQLLTQMDEASHRTLHKDMNDFLRTRTDDFGNHMRPQRGNSSRDIQQNFTREQCVAALCEFYRGPGAKYEGAAEDFFKQHPGQ